MYRPGKDKGIASPMPLGLAGLASTTFLIGVGAIFQAPAAWTPYVLQALLFGGLIELLAGIWAFAYGDAMAATAFSFLAAFNIWWGLAHSAFLGAHAATSIESMGLVFIVSGVVVLYLWVASFYESATFNLVLLFLWIGYGLVGISMMTRAEAIGVIGGIAAVISGLIAAYGSFAEIYNATALMEVIPLGEPAAIRERSRHEEEERIRRLHPIEHHA
ncbi:MAG TPA: acetate uptake transporter [Candidatus Binataceae bacterium]|nr:acetate uptake transporter [Candidatus Binataceae bacterium]